MAGILINPAHGRAQIADRVSGGLTLGMTPNLAEAFASDQICPRRWAVSASARVAAVIVSQLQMEVLGEFFQGPPAECVDAPLPMPPASGAFTRTVEYYGDRLPNPPPVLSIRLGTTALSSATVAVRPYVGIGQLVGKGITVPEVGVSVFAGRGRVRLLFEMEAWLYTVPKVHVEERFLDGARVQRSVSAREIHVFTTVFRVGLASRAHL
jgi:hypothetical protein